jgi:mannose-6-phosphate isomerase-like protein (cupin superfamily)
MAHFLRGLAAPDAEGRRACRFEGEPYGAPVSLFVDDDAVGEGPGLHRHPYPETFVVQAGQARFTVGDEQFDAAAGDLLVVPADTPHAFVAVGDERLRLIAIHCAQRMATEWLE